MRDTTNSEGSGSGSTNERAARKASHFVQGCISAHMRVARRQRRLKRAWIRSTIGYWMMALATVLTLGFAGHAKAEGTATLSWTAPESRIDGTPLKPEEIQGYNIQFQAPGQDWAYLTWATKPPYKHTGLAVGENCYRISVKLHDGLKSDWSEIKCIQIGAIPVAPQIKLMQIEWLSE